MNKLTLIQLDFVHCPHLVRGQIDGNRLLGGFKEDLKFFAISSIVIETEHKSKKTEISTKDHVITTK